MNGRVRALNRHLKEYDRELYCQVTNGERVDVYRQNRDKLSPPHYIFSLTENWSLKSQPAEWGIEPVIARLKAIDLWANGVTVEQLAEDDEKRKASSRRGFRNNIEAFMGEFRRTFAKATDSINTSLLPKTYKERTY